LVDRAAFGANGAIYSGWLFIGTVWTKLMGSQEPSGLRFRAFPDYLTAPVRRPRTYFLFGNSGNRVVVPHWHKLAHTPADICERLRASTLLMPAAPNDSTIATCASVARTNAAFVHFGANIELVHRS
jgi:hypothetical protein